MRRCERESVDPGAIAAALPGPEFRFAQGCPRKNLRAAKRQEIAFPISSWPGLARPSTPWRVEIKTWIRGSIPRKTTLNRFLGA
jgi:hypothetical protein